MDARSGAALFCAVYTVYVFALGATPVDDEAGRTERLADRYPPLETLYVYLVSEADPLFLNESSRVVMQPPQERTALLQLRLQHTLFLCFLPAFLVLFFTAAHSIQAAV